MYDPKIGRWISEDPLGFAAEDPNLYRYVLNNPTDLTDPSGLQPVTLPRDIYNQIVREVGRRAENAASNVDLFQRQWHKSASRLSNDFLRHKR
jgi:uncharacterized protein RhaS with RHS repeats